MARVDALEDSRKQAPKAQPEGLDRTAKIKIAIAAAALVVAVLLLLNFTGAFSSPYVSEQDAEPILTPEQQQDFEKFKNNPPPDPEAPITDPANPPPAGS